MIQLISVDNIEVPEERQRLEFPEQEMAELRASILTAKGLMCPIFVRPLDDGKFALVAGERRLRSIKTIDTPYNFGKESVQPGHVPCVVQEFSSDLEILEAELHENIIRLDLTWQEKCQAIAKLHKLKQAQDPEHTKGETARLISKDGLSEQYPNLAPAAAYKQVNKALLVEKFLGDEEVSKAKSLTEAVKVVSRKLEQETLQMLRDRRKTALPDSGAAGPVAPIGDDFLAGLEDDDETPPAGPVFEFLSTFSKGAVLHEGDMREKMAEIPDGSVQVVIADPPYGMGVDKFQGFGHNSQGHTYSEEGFVELHEFLIKELDRICAANAHVYIFCDPFVVLPGGAIWWEVLPQMFSKDWIVRRTPLIWNKMTAGALADGTSTGYGRAYESILMARRGQRGFEKVIPDVISVPRVKSKTHAAQKPPLLYQILLDQSSVPGDVVLDPFAGSGTIFLACKGRAVQPIGIELNPVSAELCRMAMEGKSTDFDPEL